MFGISWTEFLVILLVAICVVPAKYWPDIARFFAKIVKFIRSLVWKVSDFSEEIQQRIELEKPIDDLISDTANHVFKDVKITKKKKTKQK